MEAMYTSGRTKCNQSKSKQDNTHHKTTNSVKIEKSYQYKNNKFSKFVQHQTENKNNQ